MPRLLGPLDRYILGQFFRIFFVTAAGFPVLVILIDATDKLGKYLQLGITWQKLALSYVYFVPESLFMVLPASVLFATVFTIGSLTRHSEVTAAKASGISFYRLIAPLAFGATFAMALGLVVGEVSPVASARRSAILGERSSKDTGVRYKFAYSTEDGRVYTVDRLDAGRSGKSRLQRLEILRRGTGPAYPTTVTIANEASWDQASRLWYVQAGVMHIVSSDDDVLSLSFVGMRDRHLKERPEALLQRATLPAEMPREELGRYITAMQRSGVDVNLLRVERMLRIAIPATCLIIFLFGAPLATSSQRGGAAFGVGIALATTVLFLMLVQLTKAFGSNGIVQPELAAWIPSAAFGIAGVVLLARVRT